MTNNQLQTIVQRIEKLEEEKAAIASDIKDVFSEAKSNGFDTKVLKKILALRKQDATERMHEQALISTYMEALGMLADTPLGKAAMKTVTVKASSIPTKPSDYDDDF